MKRREILLVMGSALAGMSVPGIAAAASAAQEKTAPPFAVDDVTGKRWTLEEFKGKIVVLEWTSPSCPFVRAQYASGTGQIPPVWA